MQSVLDAARLETRQKLARLSPSDRIRLALELGDVDLELLCEGRRLSRSAGRRLAMRRRQSGRYPSPCLDPAR